MTNSDNTSDYSESLSVVLDNFTQTTKSDRFTTKVVTNILRGILDELTPSNVDERPQELIDIISSTETSSIELEGWRKSLWLQRLDSVFTKANGWKFFGSKLSSAIKSLDSDEYVPTLDVNANIIYYSVEAHEAVSITNTVYDLEVRIYSTLSVDKRVQRFEDLVEKPDPFEGRIVKMTRDGAEILDLNVNGLQAYTPEAEAAVKWMGAIATPRVRRNLLEADLEPRAGLLLEGPPGSGKTTLARREAVRHAGAATVLYPSPDMDVEEIFDFAERYEVTLVILEDVESFFGERGGSSFSDFLNALDGASETSGLMILATTNDSSKFDEAIRRPGRLERKAVISSIHEGFMRDLVGARLAHFGSDDLDKLADRIQKIAEYASAAVTPALADSVSRAIIMGNMTASEAIEFVNSSWAPSYQGESYVD